MPNVRRALALSFLQNYATTLIQFVASLFIARLLTPAEFGTFSVAMVLVGLAQVLRDFGVADYIAQERDLTIDKIRAAATLALLTGLTLAALVFAAAWPASIYFREPGVGKVMSVLALSFLLTPFGTVTMAWVRRNLDFGKVVVVRVAAGLVGSSTSVALAFAGLGYMSMAWGLLAASVVTILLSLRYRPRDWPWRPTLRHLREVVHFGTWSTGLAITTQMFAATQDVIIGRGLSLEAVGFFGRANSIIEIVYRVFTSAVYSVASPYFAAKDRSGGDVRKGFCTTVRYLTALMWPALAGVSILAPELISVLYGKQWLPSVDLVRILTLGNILYVPYILWNAFYVGLGRLRPACIVLLFSLICRVLVLIVSVTWGLTVLTAALAATSIFSVLFAQVSLRRQFGIPFGDIVRAAAPSLATTVPTVGVAVAVAELCRAGALADWMTIVATGASSALVWIALIFVVRHPIAEDLRRMSARRVR